MDERVAATRREKIAPRLAGGNGSRSLTSISTRFPQQADGAQISLLAM